MATGSDFGKGGAPDAVRLHAAAEKLLLQTRPLGLCRADFCSGPGFAQLFALPWCRLRYRFNPALASQDAMLQVGAEFTHGLAQPGHKQHRAEVGGYSVQLRADGGQDVANTGHTALTQRRLHRGRVHEPIK